MPRPPIDYATYLRLIPQHVAPLAPEASVPIRHYVRHANEAWNLLVYVQRNLNDANVYDVSLERHLQSLRVMVMLSLIEAFERLLKELAALCIDQVGPLISDERLSVFSLKGDFLASTISAGNSLGSTLCESLIWCDCDETNKRFRRILAQPYEDGHFYVFPHDSQQPPGLRGRYELISIVWQIRHSIVHNRGILTASDAYKLRILCNSAVNGPARLNPSRGDVWYTKLYLDETAELLNRHVAARLAELLTSIHQPARFDAGSKCQEIANSFGQSITLAGETRDPL